jgi:hypothetical protein
MNLKKSQLHLIDFDETIVAAGGQQPGAFAVPGDGIDVFVVCVNCLHQFERGRVRIARFRSTKQTNQVVAAASRNQTRQRTPATHAVIVGKGCQQWCARVGILPTRPVKKILDSNKNFRPVSTHPENFFSSPYFRGWAHFQGKLSFFSSKNRRISQTL